MCSIVRWMDTRERLYEFGFLAVWCSVAAWGTQFLPADDYQPSRPLYAFGWLIAAVGLIVLTRSGAPWLRSAANWLVGIFGFLLVVSFMM